MVQIRRVLAAFVAAVVGSCVLAIGARAASATLYVDNTNPAATDTSNNCQTQSTPLRDDLARGLRGGGDDVDGCHDRARGGLL